MKDLKNKNIYDASSIKFFEGLSGIQARPSMYIGDIHESIFHLLFEIVSNSIDECINGYCNEIEIYVTENNGVIQYEVKDNARGIPIDIHKDTGRPAIELIMTTIHSGGKFDNDSYSCSGGLHGVGAAALNALSEFMEVDVYRDKTKYFIRFEKGLIITPLENHGYYDSQGTTIRFVPNLDILKDAVHPSKEIISAKLRELSFLNSGLKITLNYKGSTEVFFSKDGIKEYLLQEIKNKTLIDPIYIETKDVKVVFTWNDEDEIIHCFTNQIRQSQGGHHLTGFKTGISRIILNYINNNIKTKIEVIADDARAGLSGILLFFSSNPQFSSQTKERLVLDAARKIVDEAISSYLFKFLEENPSIAQIICKKVINEAERRLAHNSLKVQHKQKSTALPVKLKDCRYAGDKDYEKRNLCELIIVEGDSAGGSSKGGRDPEYQAILPIRGKILNTLKATSLKHILMQEDINNLINSLGIPIFATNEQIQTSLRYGKVIIMTDADIDGSHIRVLLLALFLKLYPELIEQKKIYIARAPLYKIIVNRKPIYIKDEKELENFFLNRINNLFSIKINNITLNEKEVNELYEKTLIINEVLNKVQIPSIDIKLLSICLIFKVFDLTNYDNFINTVKNNNLGKLSIIKENNIIKFKLESLYGCLNYILTEEQYLACYKMLLNETKLDDIDSILKIFQYPIIINEYNYYNVIDLLSYINDQLYKNIGLQRYKGLGEMDPEQLWETTLNAENRALWLVEYDDTQTEVFKYVNELMGDEKLDDRRNYILSNIQKYCAVTF